MVVVWFLKDCKQIYLSVTKFVFFAHLLWRCSTHFNKEKSLISHWYFFPGKWLVPPKPSPKKSWCQMFSEKLPHHFSASYWKNNRPFLCFLYFIIGLNIVAMVQRAYYFKDFSMLNGYTPNFFYMVSRACGKLWYLDLELDCLQVSS